VTFIIIFIYFLIFISPIIVGIVLSSIGMKRQRNVFNITGLSLNIFSLLIYIIKLFLIL